MPSPAKKRGRNSARSPVISTSRRPPKGARKKRTNLDDQPAIQVLRPEAYLESTVLLSDEIFETEVPEKWIGHLFRYCVVEYNAFTRRFVVRYEKQTILDDGTTFLSDDDGEVEIMEDVALETIELGAKQYSAALARISEHRKEERGVVAKSLKQDDSYLLPTQVDLSDINQAVTKMGAKGWKAIEMMEVRTIA